MLYSILIYDREELVEALSEEEEAGRLDQHRAMQQEMAGQLGPWARLMPTTAAMSVRGGPLEETVLDGPFAETKEQLLGFYTIECESLEEAIAAAKKLPLDSGTLEVRPVMYFDPGQLGTKEP